HASPRIRAECSTLLIIIGRMVLSSKLPRAPARAMALSSPITCMQTIIIDSSCVGLTFPGMIEEPGSFGGRLSSCNPARGPEPSHRMSLAIFIRDTANVLNAALALTVGPAPPWAAYLFDAVSNG